MKWLTNLFLLFQVKNIIYHVVKDAVAVLKESDPWKESPELSDDFPIAFLTAAGSHLSI